MFGKTVRLKIETYYQYLYNIPVDTVTNSSFTLLNFGAEFSSLPVRNKLTNKGTGNNKGVEITFEKTLAKDIIGCSPLRFSIVDIKHFQAKNIILLSMVNM